MEHKTIVDLLQWRAEHQADQSAYTFLQDGERQEHNITYGELHQQAQQIAKQLATLNAVGERALLLYPSGLEFIAAFFGCLIAGVVAVPTYPPRKRTDARFQSIAADAEAKVVLSTSKILDDMEGRAADIPWVQHRVATDQLALADRNDATSVLANISTDSLAFLQYTSGSTSTPKGVMVSHGNLLHNQQVMQVAFGLNSECISCGWLPMIHDMGLIGNVLQPFYTGFPCILMPPAAFIEQPIRWLRAISNYRATSCVAPNFAYEFCVDKTTPSERDGLDLSSWQVVANAAEPIQEATMERFYSAFEPYGLRWDAFCTCYGLAEATLLVTADVHLEQPVIMHADPEQLQQNRIVPSTDERRKAIVGCGRTWVGQQIAIVDPETHTLCDADQIGEIWLQGESVAQGYWQKPDATAEAFHACLADTGEGPFLRTGDLGFMRGEELFVTGRLKNIIIIRGRNYYPHDIELTAEQSHSALQSTCCAAFSLDGAEQVALKQIAPDQTMLAQTVPDQRTGENLMIVCELQRQHRKADIEEVAAAIRGAVSKVHELKVYGVVLLRPGQMPKTTSGKLQHHLCKELLLSGNLLEIGRSIPRTELKREPLTQDAPMVTFAKHRDPTTLHKEEDNYIEELLRSKIAELLDIPSQQIDFSQPIVQLGLGSLHAIELQHYIETELEVEIPAEQFFEVTSLQQLIVQIAEGGHRRHRSYIAKTTAALPNDAQQITSKPEISG